MKKHHFLRFSDEDIEEMFAAADIDKNDHISYDEFYHMIVPAKPPITEKPSKAEFVDFYRNKLFIAD